MQFTWCRHLFKINNGNTRSIFEICLKLPIVNFEQISHISWCFYCWIWTSKCRLGTIKSTIIFIIFWRFLAVEQIFLSPQVKWSVIIVINCRKLDHSRGALLYPKAKVCLKYLVSYCPWKLLNCPLPLTHLRFLKPDSLDNVRMT